MAAAAALEAEVKARGEVIERLEGRLAEREGDENKLRNE